MNKRRLARYKSINPFVSGGHTRQEMARHVLTYLVRRALGIFRYPGAYDLELDGRHFRDLSPSALAGAVNDIRRIYDHTQGQMLAIAPTISLVRGVSGREASVIASLLDEVAEEAIPVHFQSLTFFNHVFGPFSKPIEFRCDCPVSWVWASAYTLTDLELRGTDEEVIVACQSETGTLNVPKSAFQLRTHFEKIEPLRRDRLREPSLVPGGLPVAISALLQDGFEPDDFERLAARYVPGAWEARLSQLGRFLDERLSASGTPKIRFQRRRMH